MTRRRDVGRSRTRENAASSAHPKPAIPFFVFALTLLVSGGLLFLIQPMFSRMILPRFGGAPAVWNTCLVFFQATLLLGYGYAHLLSTRLDLRRQVFLHTAVLLAPLVSLPIAAAGWNPPAGGSPIPWLLGLLAVSVGLPFCVVSTTAPLLQRWFSRTPHPAATDPYFLYAASNVGSLLGLIAYPLLLEPTLPLRAHSLIWTGGYFVLIGLVLAVGVTVLRTAGSAAGATASPHAESAPIPARRHRLPDASTPVPTTLTRLRWLALSFVPASLLMSVTLSLTADIAAIPLLWVIPLSLYLLSFLFAFARRQPLRLAVVARVMPLFVIVLTIVLISEATHPVWLLMIVHLSTFFVVALVCHGELARLRPPAQRLTEFYLYLSGGGILGGLFNTLVEPLVFRSVAEYPLMLIFACLLRPAPSEPAAEPRHEGSKSSTVPPSRWPPPPAWLDLLLPLALGVCVIAIIAISERAHLSSRAGLAMSFGVPALICYSFLFRPVRFALGIATLFLAALFHTSVQGDVLHAERSFFGLHRIALDPSGTFIQLVHGNTVHGKQRLESDGGSRWTAASVLTAKRSPEPLAYYHRTGPIGDVFLLPRVKDAKAPVAVVGLGAGSLAAYTEPGQRLDFYEIDPAVRRIAQNPRYFTFLTECRGDYRIILGDARLKLAHAGDQQYGIIVVDAFTSDAIPLHLITRQAVEMYVEKLMDGGLVAFNVSNRYLDLAPVLANVARSLNLACMARLDRSLSGEERLQGKEPSIWVVVSRGWADLKPLADRPGWRQLQGRAGAKVWIDDYANVVTALRWE